MMTSNGDTTPALRLTLLSAVVVVLFVALFSRLWFLQVLAGDRYVDLAESNAERFLVLEAPRGRILSAGGAELVHNRPAQTVSGDPRRLVNGAGAPADDAAAEVIRDVATVLGMSPEEVVEQLSSRRYSPFRPVPIREDVPPDVTLYLDEHREHFPGIVTETQPVRTYPHGALAAHVLGYTREVSDDQLASARYADHRLGDLVGGAGLEDTYEEWLRGEPGLRRLEVNAQGTVLGVVGTSPPQRGNDLVTTLDLDLQVAVERHLAEGIEASRSNLHGPTGRRLPAPAGAAVVLDPRDGAILAMASNPAFDPAVFVGGLQPQDYDYVFDPDDEVDHHKPILNRAIQGQYAPGSTWKIVSGWAALDEGQISPSTRLSCPAVWGWGKRNWNSRSEGAMDLATALMRSCDTFFYEVSYNHWLAEQRRLDAGQPPGEAYRIAGERFGFGSALGIDLPDEKPGRVPGRAWKRSYWEATRDGNCARAEQAAPGSYTHRLYRELCEDGWVWRGGDAANASIGQGDVLVTPLQLAAAFGAVANGGTVWQPHLADEVVAPDGRLQWQWEPRAVHRLRIADDHLAELRQGLEDVVMQPRGTAHGAFVRSGFPLEQVAVAGKTGTAEVGGRFPTALFASYAPVDDPRFVVAVVVEQGGGGSQTAAPIASRILRSAFGLDAPQAGDGAATSD